jgi:hypothetical protein
MNVEIGAEAALFPEKEYIKEIFVAVQLTWLEKNQTFDEVVKDSPAHPNIPKSSAR